VLAAKVVEWLALTLIPVLSAVRAKYPTAPAPPRTLLEFIHGGFLDRFVTILAVLALIGILARIVQEYLSPESKVRAKAVLDYLLDAYFTGVPAAERYHNRVTLFKANRRKTRLAAYCRSGTQYQRGIQPLHINDDDENLNEGVAGQAWFRNATVSTTLPECPNRWSDADPACLQYAREGRLPLKVAGRLHVKSRSVLATPVRDFGGRKWGVLVLDSRKPDAIDPTRSTLVESVAAALGKSM
jgi:hypothetical protein